MRQAGCFRRFDILHVSVSVLCTLAENCQQFVMQLFCCDFFASGLVQSFVRLIGLENIFNHVSVCNGRYGGIHPQRQASLLFKLEQKHEKGYVFCRLGQSHSVNSGNSLPAQFTAYGLEVVELVLN